MKVGEFFVDLGVTASGASTLKDFLGIMGNMKLSTLGTISALGAVGGYILGVVDNASGAAVAFQKFTNQTGLSAQELQRWQIVAKMANVSANTVAGGVMNLQDALAAIQIGQGNIAPFQILGVSPLGDAFDVLMSLRQRMGQIDPAQFKRQISAMGLSPEMMNVLKLSDAEFNTFVDTARGMSAPVEDSVLKMTQAFNVLWLKLKDINYQIAGLASGPITKVLGAIVAGIDTSSPWRALGSIPAAASDTLFGTNISPWLKGVNARWEAQQKRVQTNNVAVTVNGDTSKSAIANQIADEVTNQLSKFISGAEAQTPVYEDQPGDYVIPGVVK